MSLLPATLSKTVRQELLPESQFANEDELVARLKALPRIMLAFFNQAIASRSYMIRHERMVSRIICEINLQVHALVIPQDEIFKSMSICFKYTGFNPKIIPNDLVVIYEGDKFYFNALVMMKECLVLRHDGILKPLRDHSLQDLAPELSSIEEFQSLYKTFLDDEFTYFNIVKNETLFRMAVQAQLWGYSKGTYELQEIICKRLIHYADLIEYFGKASFYQLIYIENFCLLKLGQFEFSNVVQEGFNYFITTRFDFEIEFMNHLRPVEKQHFCDHYYEEHLNPNLPIPASLDRIEIATDSEGAYVIKSLNVKDLHSILEIRESTKLFAKVNFDRSIITSWVLDGRNPLKVDQIYGMAFYYTSIFDVSFYYYDRISEGFFLKFVKIVQNLKYIRIKDCKKIDPKVLLYIAEYLKCLKSIILNKTDINESAFKKMLSLPELVRLEISYSSIVLPEFEDTIYNNLLYLNISNCRLSGASLKSLLKCLPSLSFLGCENVQAFTLKLIPYPDKLKELRLHCDQLLGSIEENVDIDSFTNLKYLYLAGHPCKRLKAHLPKLMAKIKVTFKN